MDLWVATSNKGKLAEIKSLLMPLNIKLHSPNELPVYHSPDETGTTFKENARIKALFLKALVPDQHTIGEDSGLIVPALNAQPGVHSARYAGPNASDDENNAKLLRMVSIRCATQREAYFQSTICLITPSGEEYFFDGQVEGSISKKFAGRDGFGYDPCFIPKGQTQTFAELGLSFKNKISHRKVALRKLLEHLKIS